MENERKSRRGRIEKRTEDERMKRRIETDPEDAMASESYSLRLYVAGQTPKSLVAFANLKRICEEHLAGRYRIEVIDLLKQPQAARTDQIFVIPTLVRKLPEPMRKIIGDLSDKERVLVALEIELVPSS